MNRHGLMDLGRVPWKKKRAGKQRDQSMPGSRVTGNQFVNLVAAMLAIREPRTNSIDDVNLSKEQTE